MLESAHTNMREFQFELFVIVTVNSSEDVHLQSDSIDICCMYKRSVDCICKTNYNKPMAYA